MCNLMYLGQFLYNFHRKDCFFFFGFSAIIFENIFKCGRYRVKIVFKVILDRMLAFEEVTLHDYDYNDT